MLSNRRLGLFFWNQGMCVESLRAGRFNHHVNRGLFALNQQSLFQHWRLPRFQVSSTNSALTHQSVWPIAADNKHSIRVTSDPYQHRMKEFRFPHRQNLGSFANPVVAATAFQTPVFQ